MVNTTIQCSGIQYLEQTRTGNNIVLVLSSMSTICFALATLYLIVNLVRLCFHRCSIASTNNNNNRFGVLRRISKLFNSASKDSTSNLLHTPQQLYSSSQLYLQPQNEVDDGTPKVSGSDVSLFFETQTLFYILMICFCLLRGSYYAAEMVLDILSLTDEFSLVTIGVSATANAAYHWASTFFYSAFFVLAIKFCNYLLFLFQML